jgi:hypothetical protein
MSDRKEVSPIVVSGLEDINLAVQQLEACGATALADVFRQVFLEQVATVDSAQAANSIHGKKAL